MQSRRMSIIYNAKCRKPETKKKKKREKIHTHVNEIIIKFIWGWA